MAAHEVEAAQVLQLATLLHVERSDALGELLEDAAVSAFRTKCAARDCGDETMCAREEAQNLAGLAVGERLQDDCVRMDQRHRVSGASRMRPGDVASLPAAAPASRALRHRACRWLRSPREPQARAAPGAARCRWERVVAAEARSPRA